MQSAMDIMAMIQKSSIVKQKPITVSFGGSSGKSSFKSELAEARKNTTIKSSDNQPFDQVNEVKANKVEKLAKVMSNNKAVTDKIENASTETAAETKKAAETQKTDGTKEAMEPKGDMQTEEQTDKAKLKPDTTVTELVGSAQELLQQLMQLLSGIDTNETADVNTKQVEDSIQAISQKLEKILSQSADTKTDVADNVLKDLKVGLKELANQLNTLVSKNAEGSEENTLLNEKPSLQQTVNTIKQLINKMNEIKPILQQKLTKAEIMLEDTEQLQELQVKQNKDISKANDTTTGNKPSAENDKLNTAAEASAKESTDKDSKENNKESKYEASTKEAPKHQAAVDKHKSESFKIFNVLPNDKADSQINLKELNLNQKKEQMVTINKSDILNQVVKKADIIVRDGHSEMVMKLEPESLGKLNLKIVVEKGLITAKFIAESQQVKEVLESSFGQLKDALQEKGIAVQSFSVSVGQQAGDSSSNQSFNQWKQSLNTKNKAVGEFVGLDDEAVISQNPYNYHDGKFDYRA